MGRFNIKLAGIYKITHLPTEQYYIGMSVDIFSRWSSHYTGLKSLSHSSIKFKELWNETDPTEWQFQILEVCSITEFKREFNFKGKTLETQFRKLLLMKERLHMANHSRTYCLNKDDKYFN